ncbi:MAG: substrate-binding domain-containing protein [Acidimicrobiia bacterium]
MSTAAKRILAVVIALVLVGAAVGIRSVIDGGDDSGRGSTDDGGTPTLLCATELQRACEELERDHDLLVEVRPAGEMADVLASLPDDQLRDLGYDGWLTLSRDAEIVRDERERSTLDPLIGESSDRIARSPLVIGIWKDRAAALAPTCEDSVLTWKCMGDVAGGPWTRAGGEATWGVVKPGHADPATTGDGLLVIGQAASSYFGRTDLSIDDYADDGFLEWFSRLENSVRSVPFEQMLAGGPALIDMVGTTEADAGPALARASRDRREQVELLYPAPVATADVVYAPVEGAAGADDLADLLTGDDGRAALARAGWRVDGESRASGVPATPRLPARDNVPDAGSLQALLETWREVTG